MTTTTKGMTPEAYLAAVRACPRGETEEYTYTFLAVGAMSQGPMKTVQGHVVSKSNRWATVQFVPDYVLADAKGVANLAADSQPGKLEGFYSRGKQHVKRNKHDHHPPAVGKVEQHRRDQ